MSNKGLEKKDILLNLNDVNLEKKVQSDRIWKELQLKSSYFYIFLNSLIFFVTITPFYLLGSLMKESSLWIFSVFSILNICFEVIYKNKIVASEKEIGQEYFILKNENSNLFENYSKIIDTVSKYNWLRTVSESILLLMFFGILFSTLQTVGVLKVFDEIVRYLKYGF